MQLFLSVYDEIGCTALSEVHKKDSWR